MFYLPCCYQSPKLDISSLSMLGFDSHLWRARVHSHECAAVVHCNFILDPWYPIHFPSTMDYCVLWCTVQHAAFTIFGLFKCNGCPKAIHDAYILCITAYQSCLNGASDVSLVHFFSFNPAVRTHWSAVAAIG